MSKPHLCNECAHRCRTGPNTPSSPYWGSCGLDVEAGQKLKAGLKVTECPGFTDIEDYLKRAKGTPE